MLLLQPMQAEKVFSHGNCNIHYSIFDSRIHIERVFTDPKHRGKGEFKKALHEFVKQAKVNFISVCVCSDRKLDGTYDYDMDDKLIRTFKSLGFKPTELDGEVYHTDLELTK